MSDRFTGHQHDGENDQSEAPRALQWRLLEADLAYFAEHPKESEFVRPAVAGEAEHFARHPTANMQWDDVEFVLVRKRTSGDLRRRTRIPLRRGFRELVD